MHEFARAQPVGPLHSAAVLGDDVTEQLRSQPGLPLLESGAPLEELLPRMVSANAYLGADVIVRALATGAQLVVTGRVADPSLYLAAAMHHYGWSYTDWTRLAAGTAAGHLLECCAQVSGGCFAAPGRKAVPDLGRLGFPYVDMQPDGSFVVSKLQDSGGRVDLATCKEQLIYEVHDPAAYITPDCVLDITGLEMRQEGENRVRIAGARARPRTDTYKVTVGYTDGYIGEGQISYAGIDAVARAEMAAAAVRQRLDDAGHRYGEMRVDLIGIDSLHARRALDADPYEVRLRIAARTTDRKAAEAVGFETRALHVNGPAGGAGGSDPVVREVLAVQSVLIPRGQVDPQVTIREFRT
ncbi:acyclic terpene utilization AtuA family protein [Bordetella bronchiseptica]|uniref:acyclic terpene utilization AtuA family protein n=1 Tax=Bordetella bronchiseptica TaxID=518 RepID=UPI00137B8A70|nr:acyclic terpene utilization AtuA family protein [Bordetella bronchiseptica]